MNECQQFTVNVDTFVDERSNNTIIHSNGEIYMTTFVLVITGPNRGVISRTNIDYINFCKFVKITKYFFPNKSQINTFIR